MDNFVIRKNTKPLSQIIKQLMFIQMGLVQIMENLMPELDLEFGLVIMMQEIQVNLLQDLKLIIGQNY